MQTIDPLNTDDINANNQNASSKNAKSYFVLDDLSVSFGDTQVVKSLSMRLNKGEIGCFLGLSGCGKTTALRAIAGLEIPQQGEVTLNGKTLTRINNGKVNVQIMPAKRDMGMVFQDYALFSHLNVSENIGFGLHKWRKSDQKARITEMLELVELTDHADKRISELSGGQQQRIALARALAPKPELLLLDEPFSNLDMMLRESLAARVRDILKHTDTTAILVTHDQHEAFAIADKVGVMHQGRLAQWATPDVLYHQPNSAFVAEFVGEGAMINGIINQGIINTALGDIKRSPEPIHSHFDTICATDTSISAGSELNPNTETDTVVEQKSEQKSVQYFEQHLEKHFEPRFEQGEVCEYDYPNGTKIKILIRPDDIVHDDCSTQTALVTGRVFRGANFLYRLQLDNGEEVLSLISSHHDHPIGSRIGFKALMAHVVLFKGDDLDVTTWSRI